MKDLETICPYTGLRSFSEEESLYFKGRDAQILRVIAQLEQKKFLMVTGASGDGKSSLIFAGLIPEARAGFFKAKYSNWNVVSFRPERSPLSNMAQALATALRLEDSKAVETELSHGFSSLTEIYKSTSLFIDQRDRSLTDEQDDKGLAIDREAGNLLIIVDQFEEFFTNPENFPNGVPSQDARLVLNILLDTVKISLRDDLPIYIVFTMRSDYIGQCAAFRGLPEFIGFSQFFVPRLQRKELQQVIEEPAILSGNRISKRLVDRLIYDLEETEDHLPILQHVLKEIWKAADEGREEMDLIHYAMVGGMPGDKLPKEALDRFRQWEAKLSPERRAYLTNSGLSNVLDIHATRLYAEAATTYNKSHTTPITDKEARLIIGIAFACLTRIDENRAVRNRMTLEEITQIINVPTITTTVVDGVLRPFRAPENTLVRPFIEEGSTATTLSADAVLDITHEALIRNWKLLNRWAAKEFDYYNTFVDFRKQLQKWIDSGKSSGYLLPIGPLTYFENWFKSCRPNTWWINRYNSSESNPETKFKESEIVLEHSKQLLRLSARKLFVTRAFMKYGARKISAVGLGIVFIIAVGFFVNVLLTHRNEVIVERVISRGQQLLSAPDASALSRAQFIIANERLKPGFLRDYVKQNANTQKGIELVLQIPALMFGFNKYTHPPVYIASLRLADSLIQSKSAPDFRDVNEVTTYLTNWNDLLSNELNYLYFNKDDKQKAIFESHTRMVGKYLYALLRNADPTVKWEKKSINIAMAHVLNFRALSSDSVSMLIASLSPFDGIDSAKKRFDAFFPANEVVTAGVNQEVDHNGGYEILANLYASDGRADQALRCMDTVRSHNGGYDFNFANSRNVAAYFILNNHDEAYKKFVKGYAGSIGVKPYMYMRGLANIAGVFDVFQETRVIKHGNYNPTLLFLTGKYLEKIFEIYEATVTEDLKDFNERTFALALLAKHHGVLLAKKALERNEPVDHVRTNQLFDRALALYEKLPSNFVNQEVDEFTMNDFADFGKNTIKRSRIFIYPDHMNLLVNGFWAGTCKFYGYEFFNYVNTKKLWASWYVDSKDYALLNQWIGSSLALQDVVAPFSLFNRTYLNYPSLDHSVFVCADSLIWRSGFYEQLDNSWVQIRLIRDYLAANQVPKAIVHLDRLNLDKLGAGRRGFAEAVALNNYSARAAMEILQAGYANRASRFAYRSKLKINKMVTFSYLGIASFKSGNKEQASAYLDSVNIAFKEMGAVSDFSFRSFYDLRNGVVKLITLLKQAKGKQEILDLTGDMVDQKSQGIAAWTRTYSELGNYYEAEAVIPKLANAADRLFLYSIILNSEVSRSVVASENDPWNGYDKDSKLLYDFILYGNEVF